MEQILEWIRTVIFYIIFVSAIMHILPDKQYTKYVQLFMGLLFILITMEPILQLFDQDNLLSSVYQKAVYWQEYESQKDIIQQLNDQEQQAILESYESQLNEHLTQWFQGQGYRVNAVSVELTENGIEAMEAEIEAYNEKSDQESNEAGDSLEERQKETRQLKKTLSEIYEMDVRKISLKVR